MCLFERNNNQSKFISNSDSTSFNHKFQPNLPSFDLHSYIESKLKKKYNLTSMTVYFELNNLNEDLTIDLEENDIRKVFSKLTLDFQSVWNN
jgi:hypothetical protein